MDIPGLQTMHFADSQLRCNRFWVRVSRPSSGSLRSGCPSLGNLLLSPCFPCHPPLAGSASGKLKTRARSKTNNNNKHVTLPLDPLAQCMLRQQVPRQHVDVVRLKVVRTIRRHHHVVQKAVIQSTAVLDGRMHPCESTRQWSASGATRIHSARCCLHAMVVVMIGSAWFVPEYMIGLETLKI